jgi:hypothetical protein
VELPPGNQQAATHVVPVDGSGNLFPRYRVEFARCSASGGYTPDWSVLDLQPSGFLEAVIEGRGLRFQLRREAGEPVLLEYVGSLTHPDFSFRLAEIVPEDEDQLADLYSERRVVVVGCDPLTEYGGAGAMLRAAPPRGSEP